MVQGRYRTVQFPSYLTVYHSNSCIVKLNVILLGHRREETVPMVDWKVGAEKELDTNRSDRSFHSTHDSCTRDSGAGDSVISETENTNPIQTQFQSNPTSNKTEKQFVKQNIPLYYAPSATPFKPITRPPVPGPVRKPTFSTFVGDSDSESVHFVEYNGTHSIPVK